MKTYRIRYTVFEDEREYADEFFVSAENMTDERAVRLLADSWPGSPEEKAKFRKDLLEEDYADLFCDNRAIADVSWEETKPIVILMYGGVLLDVRDIPEGITVKVLDWDPGEPDADGDPIPSVGVWTGRGSSPADDGN